MTDIPATDVDLFTDEALSDPYPLYRELRALGPVVRLTAAGSQAMGMALHELATNAVKYGALKSGQGYLDISWRLGDQQQDQSLLVLEWRESGLPQPPESTRRGYGRQLIEQGLPFSLRAKAELVFGEDGVSCRIAMPLRPELLTGHN